MKWKQNWQQAKNNLTAWWQGCGPAFSITSPKDQAWQDIVKPPVTPIFSQPGFDKFPEILAGFDDSNSPSLLHQWTDPAYRFKASEYWLSKMYFGGEAFPYFDSQMGPGNLAAFLGSNVGFGTDTVWFEPAMKSLAQAAELSFDEHNKWWKIQAAIIDYALKHAHDRFLVGMPDFSNTLDVLASIYGPTETLMAMALEPENIKNRCDQIVAAYLKAFDLVYAKIKDQDQGNCSSCFNIWGPGKTSLLQCDLAAMFGPDMFDDMVKPGLEALSDNMDYTLFHLDGSQALCHLDTILGIEGIAAVEWTSESGQPWGGDPKWYELYRKIRAAGKSVQAIFVKPEEVEPLLNELGPQGIFLDIRCQNENQARKMEKSLAKWY